MLVKQVDVDKVELVQLLAHEFLAYQGMKVGWNVTLSPAEPRLPLLTF